MDCQGEKEMRELKEKPITFRTDMVQATLAGNKTNTRRVIKPQPKYIQILRNGKIETSFDGGFDCDVKYIKCPYEIGQPLWVRETWQESKWFNDKYIYKAMTPRYAGEMNTKWKSSRYMPRKAARLFLKITNIRIERVQDISVSDIWKEGIPAAPYKDTIALKMAFVNLWDSINKKRGYEWDLNSYVWVYDFEVIK